MIKKTILILFLNLILSHSIFSFDFETLINKIGHTFEVQSALLNVEQIQKEILLLSHPGDMNFSLIPSVKAISQEDGVFAEEVEISGSAAVKIPVALSPLEKEKVDFAQNTLQFAEAAVEAARQNTYIKFYKLYQNIWLLQEEEKILELELKAARDYSEILRQRFETGSISLMTLTGAEETFQERAENYSQNQLEQKIGWFELRSLADLTYEREIFEREQILIEDVPKPPELYDWIIENHPDIVFEKIKLLQIQKSLERLRKPDFDLSVQSFFNSTGNTFSANLSYNFNNPELISSINFPVYTFGETSSNISGSSSSWNVGLNFNISLGTNRSNTLYRDVLETELRNGEMKYNYLIESVNLVIRSAFQQYSRDLDTLELAERTLMRSRENYRVIKTKKELGQISDYELLESEAIVERSLWKIEAARISLEISWLNLLESAHWFNETGLKL
ncbi:MAG: TolC family protein [Spirochaetaceae bacterium]|nr:TolC family protein [Spirochaetaceae bacterium]